MTNVLIAGKEFPGGVSFAQAAQGFQRNVALTAEQQPSEQKQKFQIIGWNKSSPISTRSVVIHAENLFTKIDEAVLFFDAGWYAARYPVFSTKDSSRALDDMIAGYMLITLELLSRFSKNGSGRLIFLFKEGVTLNEAHKAVSLPGEQKVVPTGILPSAAQAAFRAFAENIASSYAEEASVQVILAHTGAAQTDGAIAEWLFPYLDSEQFNAQKKSARNIQWVKYGAKPSAGFSLFKRHTG
jgi:hypothetical protein